MPLILDYFTWNKRKLVEAVILSSFYDLHLDWLINSFMHR